MFYDDLKTLNQPLPEDLLKLKGFGDWERLDLVIDLRLADKNIPEALKARLCMEKEMIARIPGDYPYSFDEALALLQEALTGYTAEELEAARDLDMADWIYVNGEVRFHEDFLATMLKVRPELAPRVRDPERLAGKKTNFAALDAVIREMQANGGAARRWHMRHTLRVKPECVREGQEILVHLPIPVEYDYVRDFRLIGAGPGDFYVADPLAPQRTVSFRKKLEKDDEFFVEYAFEAHMPCPVLDPALAKSEHPDEYLGEQPPHIAFTPYIRAVAREIAGEEKNPLVLARRVYDFLTKRPIYSYVRNYFTYPNLPEYMLTSMKGDCGIFALSFITLCRVLGIPARWQSGLYCAPHDVGCHDWAEFYCAPWGWLPVDASFGNAAWHAGSALRHDFYFGHLEPFRLPAAREFQHPFDPPKRFVRQDPYDNQLGEAEYADAGLSHQHYVRQCVMLDWEKIPFKG